MHCLDCDQSYPLTTHGIHAIFEHPSKAIACAYLQLYNNIQQWQTLIDRLSKALQDSPRKQALLPILKAYSDNQAIFNDWAKHLESHVKPSALLDLRTSTKNTAYGYNFAYLQRDWSEEPAAQAERKNLLNAIKRALRLTESRGRALVLGMGTGRLGLQLTEYFKDIWAIDSSFGQIRQYHELLEKELTFWNVNSKNQLAQHSMVKKVSAVMPAHLKQQSSIVKYIWADALNNPFRDDYFNFVFSIYFSDVIPLPDLVNEVKRILQPGGCFLHLGPLEYHFNDIEHHYSFDELRAYFIDHGFEVMHESRSCLSRQTDNEQSLVSGSHYNNKVLLLKLISKESHG